MKPIKIAFIAHYTGLYGANRSLLNLIDGLGEYNVACYVISPSEGDLTLALKKRQVPYITAPMERWVNNLKRKPISSSLRQLKLKELIIPEYHKIRKLYNNIKIIPNLANQLKNWEIDVIYTNSSVIPLGALLAKFSNLPHIWHIREFCDLDYNLYFDWGNSMSKYILSQANATICVSEAISSHFFKYNLSNNYIIYNGVLSKAEVNRLYQASDENRLSQISKCSYKFALVGLVTKNKGQEIAIRAISELFHKFGLEAKLILAGRGREIEFLKELACELEISDKIEFWGYIDNPYDAYLASDAVLMCSKNEGMGRVTVEAMSACRPVIGYDNAGTSELIKHEHTGLLYKGEHEELAKAMKKLMENPEWAHQLGLNGWSIAREKYTIEAYANSVYKVLTSVVYPSN